MTVKKQDVLPSADTSCETYEKSFLKRYSMTMRLQVEQYIMICTFKCTAQYSNVQHTVNGARPILYLKTNNKNFSYTN